MSQSNSAQALDQAAFEALFRTHEASMYRLALQICNDPRMATEVVAEGFARAWLRWNTGGGGDLAASVRKVIVKELDARLRKTKRQPPPAMGGDPLRRALQTLPLRRRTVVVLRYQDDLSPVDAAEAAGLSLSIVKAEAKKGVRQLRRALALPEEVLPKPAAPPPPEPGNRHDVSWITQPEAVQEAESWIEIDEAHPAPAPGLAAPVSPVLEVEAEAEAPGLEPEPVALEPEAPEPEALEPEALEPEALEPEPVALEAEPEPVALEAEALEAEPEPVALEAEPEALEAEVEPEALEAEPEPVALEAEPEAPTLEAEAEPETEPPSPTTEVASGEPEDLTAKTAEHEP